MLNSNDSIGSLLDSFAAAKVAAATRGHAGSSAASRREGKDRTVDELWKQAQMRALADGNGPGDDLMKAMAAQDDRRARRGTSRSEPLGDFLWQLR